VRCGCGSWGGRCLSMGDYVMGMGARGRGERRRRVLMLPTLNLQLRKSTLRRTSAGAVA